MPTLERQESSYRFIRGKAPSCAKDKWVFAVTNCQVLAFRGCHGSSFRLQRTQNIVQKDCLNAKRLKDAQWHGQVFSPSSEIRGAVPTGAIPTIHLDPRQHTPRRAGQSLPRDLETRAEPLLGSAAHRLHGSTQSPMEQEWSPQWVSEPGQGAAAFPSVPGSKEPS